MHNYWDIRFFGFGFSPLVNDYKIVTIGMIEQDAKVNSLSKRSWEELDYVIARVGHMIQPIVIVNGTVFWLGWGNIGHGYIVISFDIAMEEFSLISIPLPSSISCLELKLIVYENKLALFRTPNMRSNIGSPFIDLWVMDQESSSPSGNSWWGTWTKK
ncbi:putative F-box protein At5g62660 [Prosopis cineraria]|uniref:putative F-box protein At5g62660 n=1 Tax=Prosopis cineraria TaxID=364024 RepID=UPI002410AAC3|nr:putative F-box protein At5g62660 [Prosopis cineraria]